MASRALPDLIARIRLDSSGVDESLAGLTKSFSRTNLEMAGAAAGIAGIVGIAKSFIGITEAMDTAQGDLAQAFHGNAAALDNYKAQIADFIDANQKFIPDQAAVVEGFAVLTREGGDVTRVTRDMGIALDISAAKHKSLAEAVNIVALAEAGRFKQVADAGVDVKGLTKDNIDAEASLKAVAKATDDQTTAQKNLADAQRALLEFETGLSAKRKITELDLLHEQDAKKKVADATNNLAVANGNLTAAQAASKSQIDVIAAAMIQLQEAYLHGRDSTSKLSQSQNELSGAWDRLANDAGPPLLYTLQRDTEAAADFLDAIGDPKKWAGISDNFVKLAKWIQNAIGAIPKSQQQASGLSPGGLLPANPSGPFGPANPAGPTQGRAVGGPVMPNSIYTVGEHGPETLIMGPQGGMVLPSSTGGKAGGVTVNVTVMGSVQSERNLVLAIREGIRRVEAGQR